MPWRSLSVLTRNAHADAPDLHLWMVPRSQLHPWLGWCENHDVVRASLSARTGHFGLTTSSRKPAGLFPASRSPVTAARGAGMLPIVLLGWYTSTCGQVCSTGPGRYCWRFPCYVRACSCSWLLGAGPILDWGLVPLAPPQVRVRGCPSDSPESGAVAKDSWKWTAGRGPQEPSGGRQYREQKNTWRCCKPYK